MKKMNNRHILILLTLFIFASVSAMDIYVPSLPSILNSLNTTQSMLQFTLSAFVFTLGFGQLIFGKLCDRFGRKKILLFGFIFFIIGSLCCAMADDIKFLI